MSNAPGKLVLAAAALVGVWIVTYWLWPINDQPPAITFDDVREVEAAPASAPARPESPAPSADSKSSEKSQRVNSVGATLEPAPTPTFKPVVPPELVEHIVTKGETIWTLAQRYFGDRDLGMVIARANPKVDPQKLRVGMTLLIPKDPRNIQGTPVGEKPAPVEPTTVQYTVQAGDTLSEIAAQLYGKSSLWTRIRDANRHQINEDGTNLRPGMKLLIPPPPEERNR